VERGAHGGRRLFPPELLYQLSGRNLLVRVKQQIAEEGALPRRSNRDGCSVPSNLEGSEDAKFKHRHGICRR
jgi:hypothetical protein